jgi:hypothetical protein
LSRANSMANESVVNSYHGRPVAEKYSPPHLAKAWKKANPQFFWPAVGPPQVPGLL